MADIIDKLRHGGTVAQSARERVGIDVALYVRPEGIAVYALRGGFLVKRTVAWDQLGSPQASPVADAVHNVCAEIANANGQARGVL